MSQENQSCLRFSLEESLWFRKGQEVEELISISLDPDITIQENDQYVTIRGSLELTGEYKSYEASAVSEEEGVTSHKFVERVAETEEDGCCEFSHRFPVDITIPNNRIQSIYDIDVLVDSFDYSIPERSCLKLSAELTISGLYGSEQQQEEEKEYEVLHRADTLFEDVEEAVEIELEVEQPAVQSSFENNFLFEAEARKPQEEEPVEVLPKFPTFNYQPKFEYEEEEEHEEQEPLWDLQEARSDRASKQDEVEVDVLIAEETAPHIEMHQEILVVEESSSSSSSSEEPPKQVKKKKAVKKKSMTLTEFLARKDENSAQTRLRVCIVQKGDTVATLADRYDVTVPNLLRENNLELNQDVHEGQVLYIPNTFAKK